MKTIISTFLPAVTVAAIPLGLLAGSASVAASTIYSDAFPGSASASLGTTNGFGQTSPPASGPTWSITNTGNSTGWMANGQCTLNDYAHTQGILPFTPATGQIYTLSVGFGPVTVATTTSISWGFLSVDFFTSGGYAAQMLDYAPGNSDISILANNIQSGDGVSNGNLSGFGALGYQGTQSSTVQTLQIILNTSGTDWTLQFSDNGVTAGSPSYTYSANPAVTDVGISSLNGDGQASNFALTDVAVPEPATLGLVAVGGLGLLLIGRKRTIRRNA